MDGLILLALASVVAVVWAIWPRKRASEQCLSGRTKHVAWCAPRAPAEGRGAIQPANTLTPAPARPHRARPALQQVSIGYDDFDDDRRYEDFVAAMWVRPGIHLGGIKVERVTKREEFHCELHSLVTGDKKFAYVNLLENQIRKTYASDRRHKWRRDGEYFASSAFDALLAGADPDQALRHAAHPDFLDWPLPAIGSLSGLVYGMEYVSGQGEVTNRVFRLNQMLAMPGVPISLHGHCFLRNELREFRADRIQHLSDHRTGSPIFAIGDHFLRFVDSSIAPDHRKAMDRALPGLKVLLWAAQGSRTGPDANGDVLFKYVEERSNGLQWDRDLALYRIQTAEPTFKEAAAILARFPRKGQELRLVRKHAEALAATEDLAIGKRVKRLLPLLQ